MVHELSFQAYSDRLPPQNIDAEEAILGGILLDPEAIGRVSELLRPDAFYISAHQEIYRASLALHTQGKPTDLMTVTTYLRDRDLLDKVGGQVRLVQLVDRTVSAVNIDQYAQLVMDKFLRRKLIQTGTEVAQLGYDLGHPLEQVLDQAEQKVFAITQVRPSQSLVATSDILLSTFADIEQRSAGMVLPGISCGFYDLDAITQGFQRSDLIIAAGRPSMGKCLSEDAEILLADGSLKTIGDIYRDRSAVLLTLGAGWRFQFTRPSAYINDGYKPVYRVKTQSGRVIETTLTHPYLTQQGWRPLGELRVGQPIAVPRCLPVFGSEQWPDHHIKLLADWLGGGCLTGSIPPLTQTNPRIQQEFQDAVLCLTTGHGEGEMLQNPQTPARPDALMPWLQEQGVWGKSASEVAIPPGVFRLERSQLALFLNRLFAASGWVTALATGQVELGLATASATLARQVHHLLLRFGILANLTFPSTQAPDAPRSLWQLAITDVPSLQAFLQDIGMVGREEAIAQVEAALTRHSCPIHRNSRPGNRQDTLQSAMGSRPCLSCIGATPAGIREGQVGRRAATGTRLLALAPAPEHPEFQDLATGDIHGDVLWDAIVDIEPQGLKPVYDLTIPGTHNFVANDICVHNTSFVLNIARNIAAFHKMPVAVFSLEMSKEQLVYRMLSSEVQIESGRLRSGRIGQHEWERLGHAISLLSQMPIYIDDTPNISVNEMRSKARRLQAEQGGALGLILIDYLQLMEGSGDNRVQELSKVTRSLKALARELNVPVIALSQLSRGVEARTNKRPMMSDLRESGSIEQDADLIMMLYREEYYTPDTPDRGIAEVIISKHRNGPVGTVKLLFEPQFTLFRNLKTSDRT